MEASQWNLHIFNDTNSKIFLNLLKGKCSHHIFCLFYNIISLQLSMASIFSLKF
jgi:hypothetical protein